MIKHDPTQYEFRYLTKAGEQAGKLCYRYLNETVIDVYTTKVEMSFQGKGIAGELYQAVIDFAQSQGLRIKPTCSYIEVKMQRNHQDLIA